MEEKLLDKTRYLLRCVGISTFIKYFEVFEEYQNVSENTAIIDAFGKNKEEWTTNSYKSRASKGKTIFKNNLENIALEYIVKDANKNKLSPTVIEKAYCLLEKNK